MEISICYCDGYKKVFVWSEKNRIVEFPDTLPPEIIADLLVDGFADYSGCGLDDKSLYEEKEICRLNGEEILDIDFWDDGRIEFYCTEKKTCRKFLTMICQFIKNY